MKLIGGALAAGLAVSTLGLVSCSSTSGDAGEAAATDAERPGDFAAFAGEWLAWQRQDFCVGQALEGPPCEEIEHEFRLSAADRLLVSGDGRFEVLRDSFPTITTGDCTGHIEQSSASVVMDSCRGWVVDTSARSTLELSSDCLLITDPGGVVFRFSRRGEATCPPAQDTTRFSVVSPEVGGV